MQSRIDGPILIVGLARNVEETIFREIMRLDKIFSGLFQAVQFYVVESDSTDRTNERLAELAECITGFSYTSLGKLEISTPNRIERLIHCRNAYVDWIRKCSNNAIVAVIDFDIRNTKLRRRQVARAINALPQAAGIFANQSGRYFDIYALRKDGWSDRDCNSEYWELRKELGPERAKQQSIWDKMKRIPHQSSPIEVESAFGGLGIYKSWVFREFDYSPPRSVDSLECEHIYLHKKIRERGELLYIYPGLINFGWNPHNLSSFKTFRRLDQLSRGSRVRGVRRALRNAIR